MLVRLREMAAVTILLALVGIAKLSRTLTSRRGRERRFGSTSREFTKTRRSMSMELWWGPISTAIPLSNSISLLTSRRE